MRKFLAGSAAVLLALGGTAAFAVEAADAPAEAPAPKYTTTDTEIGTLLDDPAAKAILVKYLPAVVESEQIEMARFLTLRAIQPYAPDDVTDEQLNEIDAELAKLPQ